MSEMSIEEALEGCLDGLQQVLIARLKELKGEGSGELPPLNPDYFGRAFLPHLPKVEFYVVEGLLLTLALFPHLRPQLFDRIIQKEFPKGGNLLELGGIRLNSHRGFLPTGSTALYLLAGDSLEQRSYVLDLLSSEHWLNKMGLLRLGSVEMGGPAFSGQLMLDPEFIELLTLGRVSRPSFSSSFPATYVSTERNWEDLVLPQNTHKQIQDIQLWLEHQNTLRNSWEQGHKFKAGYRALFHGSPGTGKTMAAKLLGKETGKDVFKVDLSTVVSKYIGETEKNLANLFDKAERKDWILFFDEADALFGKRTQVQNSHDKYANQEVSYLLQRIENFDGLVILASNLKNNIDDAFLRRFQVIINFPLPQAEERLQLWKSTLPNQVQLSDDVDLQHLAQSFELSGADIVNIVQNLCIHGIAKNQLIFSRDFILKGINKELVKTNRL